MARSQKKTPPDPRGLSFPQDDIPAGATRKAMNEVDNGGGPGGSPLGDRHAQGTPGGGTGTGGLAGSNEGEGDPVVDADDDNLEAEGAQGPFAGHSGGAVGGTPAEGRASGGRISGGLRPGGVHRGDSTVGAEPKKRSRRR